MKYDGANPLHVQQARAKFEKLIKEQKVFDLTEKKPQRTSNQNRYLHTIIAYFGCETGYDADWVKQQYFKKLVNPNIFIREKEDKYLGKVKYLRSSADLDTEEMSTAIDRFRDWASAEAGVYIPSPEEERLIQLMEIDIEKNKNYI